MSQLLVNSDLHLSEGRAERRAAWRGLALLVVAKGGFLLADSTVHLFLGDSES